MNYYGLKETDVLEGTIYGKNGWIVLAPLSPWSENETNKKNLDWIFSLVSDGYPFPESENNAISTVASELVTRSHHNAWRPWLGKRQKVKTATLDQGIYLWWRGYFVTIVGGHCGYLSLFEAVEMVPFLLMDMTSYPWASLAVLWHSLTRFWLIYSLFTYLPR